MAKRVSDAEARARDIIAGGGETPEQALRLVKEHLKAERKFGVARKLLDLYAKDPGVRRDQQLREKVAQQRALCTYKDPDLPADERLEISEADRDRNSAV